MQDPGRYKDFIFNKAVLTPQQRLERIWKLLRMPDSMKLDMVIKYCSDKYIDVLHLVSIDPS